MVSAGLARSYIIYILQCLDSECLRTVITRAVSIFWLEEATSVHLLFCHLTSSPFGSD